MLGRLIVCNRSFKGCIQQSKPIILKIPESLLRNTNKKYFFQILLRRIVLRWLIKKRMEWTNVPDRQTISAQKMTEMQPINYRFENLIHLLHNLFVGHFLVSLGLIHKRRQAHMDTYFPVGPHPFCHASLSYAFFTYLVHAYLFTWCNVLRMGSYI